MDNAQSAVPKRDPEISIEINELRSMVDKITEAVLEIREKFNPVLRINPLTSDSKERAIEEALTPLSTELRSICSGLSGCNDDLQRVIRDCEL